VFVAFQSSCIKNRTASVQISDDKPIKIEISLLSSDYKSDKTEVYIGASDKKHEKSHHILCMASQLYQSFMPL
jgi:hypothetical protein